MYLPALPIRSRNNMTLPNRNLKQDYDAIPPPQIAYIPITDAPKSFSEIKLEEEVLSMYHQARHWLAELYLNKDELTSPTSISSAVTAVNAALKELIKMQAEIHNQEKLKKMEEAMIEALKLAPPEIQDAFLAKYEELTNAV